uniref:ANK_REP_REGION domain-containing protein n=1 Tax=Dracunculus medinensis TaxID=318479 RepID=A0A0N4UB27_DRAME
LLSHGIMLNARDKNGAKALHVTAIAANCFSQFQSEELRILTRMIWPLELLAVLLSPNSPLATICFLISRGANPYITDNSGRSILDIFNDKLSLKSLVELQISKRCPLCCEYITTVKVFDGRKIAIGKDIAVKTSKNSKLENTVEVGCEKKRQDSKICFNIVFQCGHAVCADCSREAQLKICHICRQKIKKRTTLYIWTESGST